MAPIRVVASAAAITEAPAQIRRFAVEVDGGRRFILYAPDRVAAMQRFEDAAAAGVLVYDGPRQVSLSSLGHAVTVREESLAPKAVVVRSE